MGNKILILVILVVLLVAGVFAFRAYRNSQPGGYTMPGQAGLQQQSGGTTSSPSGTTTQSSSGTVGSPSETTKSSDGSVDSTKLDNELNNLDSSLNQQSANNANLNF